MNIPNRLTLRQVFDNPDLLKDVPLSMLGDVLDTADETRRMAETVKKHVIAEVVRVHGDAIKAKFLAEGKDTGTVHLVLGEQDLEVKVPKTVEWDQPMLAEMWTKISAAGDDAKDYIKLEYSVDEKRYAAWPAGIRSKFEPARTVKPGNPAIAITEAKVAAPTLVQKEPEWTK